MRISDVQTFVLGTPWRNLTIVKVATDEGLTGVGEVRMLGHTQARTTQRYAHIADDPLREAAEKIGTVIAGAGKPGAKVVAIKG